MPEIKHCPKCGKQMGYDFEGSVEWYKCSGCGHKEYVPKKKASDYTIGEYIAMDIFSNRVIYRGTEEECLKYCNTPRIKLYGALINHNKESN